jgi:hypothetical protein
MAATCGLNLPVALDLSCAFLSAEYRPGINVLEPKQAELVLLK